MPECFFSHLGNCQGRLVKAHLIPKQRIAREYPNGAAFTIEIVDGKADYENARWRPFDPRLAYAIIGDDGLRDLKEMVWDERCWVWMCGGPTGLGGHHGAFDAKQIRLNHVELPTAVKEFAEEYGLGWSLERDYAL